MPKISWNVGGGHIDDLEPDEERTGYDGPIPPRGLYRFALVELEYVKFATGSKGLKLFMRIDETGPKKKFNGCPVWENIVDVETADFKIQQFLVAIGATGKDWDATVIDKQNMVTKIGRIVIKEGMHIWATAKLGKNNSGEERLEVNRLIRPRTGDSDEAGADDDGDDSDDDAPPF